jgi:enamine deaminase RidA (YjgF/YER057c/UK114 family)
VIKYYSELPGLVPPLEPYSYAVQAGNTIYLAGQVALDEDGAIVGSTTYLQAQQIWHNIRIALAAAGASIENIVKINYYMQDIRELDEEIKIRKDLFAPKQFPAVTAVQAAALGLPGLKLEVDIIAVLDNV